jgi:sarcosine oxidase subunit alpha
MKIRFGEKEVEARPGDTVAAALYRAGQRIFSRSFKYHRPRGLLCVAGRCPNCLMNVDGIPNVRTCTTPVRDGMEVRHQNAYPSLDDDWLSAAQHFDWAMPVGWYYKTFTNPWVWHKVEPMIRKIAGLGEIGATSVAEYEHAWMHTHTAVIGGGYAGLGAALAASGRDESVVLIDDQVKLGGESRYRKNAGIPSEWITRVESDERIRILSRSSCFGIYEGNLLGVLQSQPHTSVVERLIHLRAKQVVVAAGAYETPLIFPNNDLAGVMLSSGAQRLMRLYGIVPGKRASIIGTGERADEIAADLREHGVAVVAVVPAEDLVQAAGPGRVKLLKTRSGDYPCDLVVVCGPRVPDAGLAAQAGAKLAWSDAHGAFIASGLTPQISVAGAACGDGVAEMMHTCAPSGRSFVCFCSDVTSKDLCDGIAEGFDQIETLKRYTTATMGPCQGRMCQRASAGLCSAETRRDMGRTGLTTSRPPNPAVTLGALAGPRHHPIRRTPMHVCHGELGAVWMDMSDWKRPRYYKSEQATSETKAIEAEYRAVREGVGIIDVSTLGKLEVRGRDAGRLLDFVYTHRFSDLAPGRVRYALMCDEAGIILDDGTISRLSAEHYFVTTTTGNPEFVYQTLLSYAAGKGWDARPTVVTAGFGSMNVAGPKARDVLKKLTDCPLETAQFPYMACREAHVASVPAILMRIGFVGETGWEVHCPAESAEEVWRTLLDAGKEFSIRPFGVEAQRLLRLEKLHAIVGVDTDALAGPFESGMGWAAKFDKDDFVGKAALRRAADTPARDRLVGFVAERGVPEDGAAVVVAGRPAGRVTSCRYSPAKRAAIGLAWVPMANAQEGASIHVRMEGALVPATVTMVSFYDPEGARLRL